MKKQLVRLRNRFYISIFISFTLSYLLNISELEFFTGMYIQPILVVIIITLFILLSGFRDDLKKVDNKCRELDDDRYNHKIDKAAYKLFKSFIMMPPESFKTHRYFILNSYPVGIHHEYKDDLYFNDKFNINTQIEHKFYRICRKDFNERLSNYPKTYDEGFTHEEMDDLISVYRGLDINRFKDSFDCNTGLLKEGKFIIFPVDIVTAFNCALEERTIRSYEFD